MKYLIVDNSRIHISTLASNNGLQLVYLYPFFFPASNEDELLSV